MLQSQERWRSTQSNRTQKIETQLQTHCSSPRGRNPQASFYMRPAWEECSQGNYYQKEPDSQPLLVSPHVPHHRVWRNTTTHIPSRHTSPHMFFWCPPDPTPCFLRTTVRQEAWPKGDGGQTWREVIEEMGIEASDEATPKTRRTIWCARSFLSETRLYSDLRVALLNVLYQGFSPTKRSV